MRIAEKIEMLEVKTENGTTHPILLWDGDEVILIDTGFPTHSELLKNEIERAGFAFNRITKIIFTHQDLDHIGCVKEIMAEAAGVSILAHEEEAPYIQGDKTPVKIAKMEEGLDNADEATKKWYVQFKTAYENRYTKINHSLKDGETLPVCGGIEVIHTPGHTPGHICLYIRDSGILIAGDGLNISEGNLIGASPQYTLDMDLARQSIKKLAGWDINMVVTFHGGCYKGDIKEALIKLSQA